MKKVSIILLSLILVLSVTFTIVGCKDNANDNVPAEDGSIKVVVKTPTGAPSLALGALFNGSVSADGLTVDSEVTSGSAVLAAVTSSSCDFAILPTFAGVQLAVKAGKYQLLATTSWGNLYFVTTDANFVSLADSESVAAFLAQFEGKHIDTIGGGKVDVAVKYILDSESVDYDMQAYEDATAITPLLKQGRSQYAVLGEPAATAATKAVDGARIVGSVAELWKAVTGADFPQASIFVRKAFAEAHPEAVTAFVNAAKASIVYFNASAANAKLIAESLSLPAVVAQCYPQIAQRYVAAADAKSSVVAFMRILGLALTEEQVNALFA